VLRKILQMEIRNLGVLLLLLVIIMKLVFFRQDFLTTTRTAIALFWMFVLPGYAILYYWKDKIDFAERVVVGVALAAGFIAITSYYLGLAGVHIKYHGIILPLAMLGIAAIILMKKKSANKP